MRRWVIASMAVATAVVAGTVSSVWAVNPVNTVQWFGGSGGEWNTSGAWRNTTAFVTGDAEALMGQRNGTDGMNNVDPALTRARNIVVGGGATVEYYWPTGGGGGLSASDFRVRQGSNLTVKSGATWVQDTDATYPENAWTRMDPSNLILDGGTFRRSGESPALDGGGIVLFGSFNDDANFSTLAPPAKINVAVTNGGRIENTGQLWFGTDGETAPNTRVKFTMNGGSMDLTGGGIEVNNNELLVTADMAFFYDYNEGLGTPNNEEFEINFTGPGSITVDQAGIYVYRQDEFSNWSGGTAPVSYQDLWNQGILKANGVSGATSTPGNFNQFFTVSGSPGTNNYQLTSNVTPIQTVEWVGGSSGEWNNANAWRNTSTMTTGDAEALMGQRNGTDGMNNVDPALTRARNIVVGGGATVEYYWPTGGGGGLSASDFRVRQGSSLTIKDGATWVQDTDATYPENAWTRMDPSNLILDGGTYRRTGESPAGDGGGIVLFGSFNDDANFSTLAAPATINVELKNGGRIENTGQLWFGTDGETAPGTRVTFTVNGGTMDLTGGGIEVNNNELLVTADMAFFYDYNEGLGTPNNEEFEINFIGPGSITVDQAGIYVYRQDEFSNWSGGTAPVSYQDLWNQGILKANGVSGATSSPGDFNDYFTVSGMPGTNDYILNSLIRLACDFNSSGACTIADIDALVMEIVAGGTNPIYDLTGDGMVTLADVNSWLSQAGEQNIGPGESYLVADANLDTVVDGTDFGIWNANKFAASGKWSKGDFNASGSTDGSDFGLWNANKFTSSDIAAVPEPASLASGVLALIVLRSLLSRRR